MGTIRDLNDVVDIAKEIMKKDKNIGWLVAIEEAKKIIEKENNNYFYNVIHFKWLFIIYIK